jgi:predicted DNA-binding WGR domain protein
MRGLARAALAAMLFKRALSRFRALQPNSVIGSGALPEFARSKNVCIRVAIPADVARQLQFAPMRLFMQTQPTGSDAPRYYQIVLQQDLLGGWMLFREWGQQGAHASSKRETFLERGAALAAFEHARDAQLKRGFQVMFAQGFDGPHAG